MAITKINTPEIFDLGTTNSSLRLPSGDTASRPSNPNTGELRYNTDDNYVEYWDGSAWFQIDYEAAAPTCTTDTINYPSGTTNTAYYKMEDATDQTGNYNGTPTNVNFNVAGKFGNAGEFNGSSSYISVPTFGGSFYDSDFSISLWVNLNSLGGASTAYLFSGAGSRDIFINFNTGNSGGGISARLYDGTIRDVVYSSAVAGNWYHVVFVRSKTSGLNLYVDGVSRDTNTFTGNAQSLSFISDGIGGRVQDRNTTDGKIDQVRIFPSALTSDQVTQLYNEVQCAPTIVPTNNFNVNTYVGNGSTQTIDAKFNEAANFNGSSSKIEANGLSISGNTSFSISLWVKPNDVSTEQWIIQYGASSPDSTLYLQLDSSGFSVNNFTTGQYYSLSITANNWYHCVIGYDSSASEIFIQVNNGTRVTKSATVNISSSNLLMGHRSGASSYFNGSIDQVRIFDSALTGNQVTDLYTNETDATAQLLNYPVGAGCIAAYELDGNADDISGLYSGTPTDIGYTGMAFQPDLVWVKGRSTSNQDHTIVDSVRGISKRIRPSYTSAEVLESGFNVTAFNSDGFTLVDNTAGAYNVNGAVGGTYSGAAQYVAWNWKAGGAPTATNSAGAGNVPTAGSVKIDGADSTTALAGTIAATSISANTEAGFSIVKYTGNGGSATLGTGLSQQVEMVICKSTESASQWMIYHKDLTGNVSGDNPYNLYFRTDVELDLTAFGAYNSFTSSVFPVTRQSVSTAHNNNNNIDYIAYCFHSVDGYSKIGSYVGTGASGNSIVTGFEPAFLLVKRTDSGDNWLVFDNKRNPSAPVNLALIPNSSSAEQTGNLGNGFSFLSNGFEVVSTDTGVNANGGSYIFMAIAADPAPEPVLADSFNTVLYTGNGTNLPVTGVGFQPDWVWIKSRSNIREHILCDSVRGVNKELSSDNTYFEESRGVNSFDTNGFTLDGLSANYNSNNESYVAWNWKGAEIPAINSNGSITSVVSANPAAGFSIVSYTGNGVIPSTYGHGLNDTPKVVIVKNRSASSNWTFNFNLTPTGAMFGHLNTTGILSQTTWMGGTSSVVSMLFENGNLQNANGNNYIAYCFAEVAGFSKFGSYTGNGSFSGNTISTSVNGDSGFEPAFVMIKCTTVADQWIIFDNKRGVVSNNTDTYLLANLTQQELDLSNGDSIDFLTNGFRVIGDGRYFNENGETYIYMAFANQF